MVKYPSKKPQLLVIKFKKLIEAMPDASLFIRFLLKLVFNLQLLYHVR